MIFNAGVLLTFVTVIAGQCCEDFWIRNGLSCYLFVGKKETWTHANVTCHNLGAHLVAIQSVEENAFIQGYLNEYSGFGAKITTWLGGKKNEKENVWQWSVSGDNFTFTDWYPGQPGGPSSEDCLALQLNDHKHGYTWGDALCSSRHSYMCEKEFPKLTFHG